MTKMLGDDIANIVNPQWNPSACEPDILRKFYRDVCEEAERIMAETNTVSGAHWNAMRRVLSRKGIEV